MTLYRTKKGIILAIAQQLPLSVYEGPSVSNSAEYLWPQLCSSLNIPSTSILMIEKYIQDDKTETADIVMNVLNIVQWKRLSNKTLENILATSTEISAQEARDWYEKRLSKGIYREWRGNVSLEKLIVSYGGF